MSGSAAGYGAAHFWREMGSLSPSADAVAPTTVLLYGWAATGTGDGTLPVI